MSGAEAKRVVYLMSYHLKDILHSCIYHFHTERNLAELYSFTVVLQIFQQLATQGEQWLTKASKPSDKGNGLVYCCQEQNVIFIHSLNFSSHIILVGVKMNPKKYNSVHSVTSQLCGNTYLNSRHKCMN